MSITGYTADLSLKNSPNNIYHQRLSYDELHQLIADSRKRAAMRKRTDTTSCGCEAERTYTEMKCSLCSWSGKRFKRHYNSKHMMDYNGVYDNLFTRAITHTKDAKQDKPPTSLNTIRTAFRPFGTAFRVDS